VFASACLAVLLAGASVSSGADEADAKGLPVKSVVVETPRPTVNEPVEVTMRLGGGRDLPDGGWESGELSVVPAAETDEHGWPLDGWPRDSTIPGTAVPLHRIGKGVYRGAVLIREAGDYTIFSRSHLYAADAFRADVVNNDGYLAPVRLRIASAPPSSRIALAWVPAAFLLAIAAAWAMRTRFRSARNDAAVAPIR
jgi:hypothetical protein